MQRVLLVQEPAIPPMVLFTELYTCVPWEKYCCYVASIIKPALLSLSGLVGFFKRRVSCHVQRFVAGKGERKKGTVLKLFEARPAMQAPDPGTHTRRAPSNRRGEGLSISLVATLAWPFIIEEVEGLSIALVRPVVRGPRAPARAGPRSRVAKSSIAYILLCIFHGVLFLCHWLYNSSAKQAVVELVLVAGTPEVRPSEILAVVAFVRDGYASWRYFLRVPWHVRPSQRALRCRLEKY